MIIKRAPAPTSMGVSTDTLVKIGSVLNATLLMRAPSQSTLWSRLAVMKLPRKFAGVPPVVSIVASQGDRARRASQEKLPTGLREHSFVMQALCHA